MTNEARRSEASDSPDLSGRAALIARAATLRAEIQQIFDDAERWNSVHVPWKGKPIDPDPDGVLRRLAKDIDIMLANKRPTI